MKDSVRSQSGSILVYILIAVALFAALSYVVSNMMRGGGNIGEEKSGVESSEVLGYARVLRESVQALKISNGCDEAGLSFEKSPFDGTDIEYVNSLAPADFSCHVFHPQGGGASYQGGFMGQNWNFTAAYDVKGLGSAAPDLVAAILVNQAMCKDINKKAGVSNEEIEAKVRVEDGADPNNKLPAFKGVYDGTAQITLATYEGKMTGCYLSAHSLNDMYTAYQVLAAR